MKQSLAYLLRPDSTLQMGVFYPTVFKYICELRSFLVLKAKINADYESELKRLGLYFCVYYSSS
jgi:hypothetical protein